MDRPMHGIIKANGSRKRYRLDRQPRSYGWNTGNCFFCGRTATKSYGSAMFLTCESHKAK